MKKIKTCYNCKNAYSVGSGRYACNIIGGEKFGYDECVSHVCDEWKGNKKATVNYRKIDFEQ